MVQGLTLIPGSAKIVQSGRARERRVKSIPPCGMTSAAGRLAQAQASARRLTAAWTELRPIIPIPVRDFQSTVDDRLSRAKILVAESVSSIVEELDGRVGHWGDTDLVEAVREAVILGQVAGPASSIGHA